MIANKKSWFKEHSRDDLMKTKVYRVHNTLLLLKVNAVATLDGICHFSQICVFGERNPLEKALITQPKAYLHCDRIPTISRNVMLFSSRKCKTKWFLEELGLALPGTAYTNTVKRKNHRFLPDIKYILSTDGFDKTRPSLYTQHLNTQYQPGS